MHRTILLLGAIASASAFSASRMGLRSSPTARSVSRSGATCVKMDASLVIASAPGLVALGLSLANGMSCCAWVYLSLPPSLFHFLSFSLSPPTPLSFSLSLSLLLREHPNPFALTVPLTHVSTGNKMGGAAVQLPPPVSASPSVTPADVLATARVRVCCCLVEPRIVLTCKCPTCMSTLRPSDYISHACFAD